MILKGDVLEWNVTYKDGLGLGKSHFETYAECLDFGLKLGKTCWINLNASKRDENGNTSLSCSIAKIKNDTIEMIHGHYLAQIEKLGNLVTNRRISK